MNRIEERIAIKRNGESGMELMQKHKAMLTPLIPNFALMIDAEN